MKIEKYNRKTFEVEAVRIVLDDIEEIAVWCGGTIEKRPHKMMGSEAMLPVINLKGTGVENANYYIGYLNYWVVKMGKTPRIYTPEQFSRTFTQVPKETAIMDAISLLTANGYRVVSEKAVQIVDELNRQGFARPLSDKVNDAIDKALEIANAEVESHNSECEV